MSGRVRVRTLVPCLLLAIACVRPAEERYREELRESPPPARHAVYSARLREIMNELARLAADRMPQELDLAAEREQRARVVAQTARALADAAEQIPVLLEGTDLNDAQRDEFRTLADALRERSTRLADEAPALSVALLEQRLDAIDRSCDDCHRRFRVIPMAP